MHIPLLDHGYIRLVESWGSDERIIEAARMSTGKGFLGWGPQHTEDCASNYYHFSNPTDPGSPAPCDCETKPGDEKLLAFLYDNKHHTPFEMAGFIVEVQAPIFVFREWHRHRTQSYNEMSARYTPLPDLNYIPSIERVMINAGTSNKQAGTVQGSETLTEATARIWLDNLFEMYKMQEELYQEALKRGIPKELARVHLPVGRYSRMRASTNLRNWLGFMTLRSAPGAQWEIRQYSQALGQFVVSLFPRTWSLFVEGAEQ